MALCVALASCKASTVAEALDFLNAHRALLLAAADEQGSLTLGDLPAELRLEPEPARMRLEQGDHEIRGHLVFGELLGQKSFFQVAALEIAGLTLSASDAEFLEKAGIVAQLADVRIWR